MKSLNDYEEFVQRVWVGKGKSAEASLRNLFIASTGLGGETGEVLEKLKKSVRDDVLDREALLKELGDVLYYLTVIARMHGYHLEDVIQGNVDKLTKRLHNNTVHGNGDDR